MQIKNKAQHYTSFFRFYVLLMTSLSIKIIVIRILILYEITVRLTTKIQLIYNTNKILI